jgi:hypothetical protein
MPRSCGACDNAGYVTGTISSRRLGQIWVTSACSYCDVGKTWNAIMLQWVSPIPSAPIQPRRFFL